MTSKTQLKQLDFSEAQARLNALPSTNNNILKSNVWNFEFPNDESINIDFNELKDMEERHPDWPLAKNFDWVLLTKRVWLSLDRSISPGAYQKQLNGLKLFWLAMAHLKLTEINKDNCNEFLTFLLTHNVEGNEIRRNLTIKSYKYFTTQIPVLQYKLILSGLGLNWISRDLSYSFIRKLYKYLIPHLTNNAQSYQDWYQGGDFNTLGLDYGQYYLEHCLTFYETNYPLAIALTSTRNALPEIATSSGYSQVTVDIYLNLVLHGYSVNEISQQSEYWSVTTIQNIHEAVSDHFISAYKQASFDTALLQDETSEEFVVACGQKNTPENIDRMRVVLWGWIRKNNKTETLRLLKEFQKPITWTGFQKQLSRVKTQCDQKPCQLPTPKDYEFIGIPKDETKHWPASYPIQLIRLVAQAGLASVVGLCGWRSSEYGWPHSAIIRSANKDKLDQYAFPYRYQVDWYVKKTKGNVRVMREVTFNIIRMAEQLQSLNNHTDEQPCLYPVATTNKNQHNSKSPVRHSIQGLWCNFVNHYSGFTLLDDWTVWMSLQKKRNNKTSLSPEEKEKERQLIGQRSIEEWNNLPIDANLKEAWQRSRKEWPQLNFFFEASTTKDKKEWLVKYHNNTLRSDWKKLLDKHLSQEVIDWLHSQPTEVLKSKFTTKAVMNNLMEDTLYPTPHGFRHMWAEAIYRRFDGDAGWMIRSQFQHISRGMWLDYVRNKDNRSDHQISKYKVISSLVQNYLKNQGKGYAGQLNIWLRRVFQQTSISSPDELAQLVDHLTTEEIENIKANPWGYCLLKRRTRSKARCAENGEPMRYNASPDLCLGCAHNLMQPVNVEWSILHAAPHIEVLRNPDTPGMFKASSYELVKNITKHARTINPLHDALPELEEAIDCYKSLRAS